MRLATLGELLQDAINYIEANNNALIEAHTHPDTGNVEPADVKKRADQVSAWVENARMALRTPEARKPTILEYKRLPWR